MLFNLPLRYFLVIYIKICATFGFAVGISTYNNQKTNSSFNVHLLLFILVFVPSFYAWILFWAKDITFKKQTKELIGVLYEGLHKYKNKWNLMYFPAFLVRRAVFMLIPTFA